MRPGKRSSKHSDSSQQFRTLGLKGKHLERAVVEIYNEIVIGIDLLFDIAVEGEAEAICGLIRIAEQTIEVGGRCRRPGPRDGKGGKRGRREKS